MDKSELFAIIALANLASYLLLIALISGLIWFNSKRGNLPQEPILQNISSCELPPPKGGGF